MKGNILLAITTAPLQVRLGYLYSIAADRHS
jgi:hypothetical protein